jgi:PTS system nitrogen regulatory IIA component
MDQYRRLLPSANVLVGLQVTSKKRLFEQIGLTFENNQGIERSKVFDSLFARERLGSTALGEGVAIPHRTHQGPEGSWVAAAVRSRNRSPSTPRNNLPVSLLVFRPVPDTTEEHRTGRNWPSSFPTGSSGIH